MALRVLEAIVRCFSLTPGAWATCSKMCGGMIEQHPELEWRWLLEDISRVELFGMIVGDKLMPLDSPETECTEEMIVSEMYEDT